MHNGKLGMCTPDEMISYFFAVANVLHEVIRSDAGFFAFSSSIARC